MLSARITVDPAFRVGPLDRRLFGTFVEHMGRSVYTGIYEPEHPTADEDGFRGDVLELVRELGATAVRYPGGNFVSGYRWEDGVGPVEDRPRRLDLAWRSIETNEFGFNEFMAWSRKAQLEPIMAVNLGTRGVEEACDLLEYANHPSGTTLSDQRVAHGEKQPHDIRMWCLGNEMDGPWQVGHKTAVEYARVAAETARAMRLVDPRVELIACGSSNSAMPTFAAWEAVILEHTYHMVDHISMHAYYEELEGDLPTFLASGVDMDRFITAVVATADHVGARLRNPKKMKISFDEWNVWYEKGRFVGATNLEVEQAPRLIEDVFSAADAVVVGDLLITLLRHADRVAIACQAQLVNVIAPIRTEPGGPAWRQTIFHPFAQTARLAQGEVLQLSLVAPTYPTVKHGDVDVLDATATWDEDTGALSVFAVNRSTSEPLEVSMALTSLDAREVVEAMVLSEDDPYVANTQEHPDRVRPRPLSARLQDGRLHFVLPPVAWAAISVACAPLRPEDASPR
jgi:alpha-N-arabinofuranosidase